MNEKIKWNRETSFTIREHFIRNRLPAPNATGRERVARQMWPIFMELGNSSRSPVLNAVNTWAIFQETVHLVKVEAKEIPARGRDKSWQSAVGSKQWGAPIAHCLLPTGSCYCLFLILFFYLFLAALFY